MMGQRMGLSSRAIAYGGRDHPRDPSDLKRCLDYCTYASISTDALRKRMAHRSPQWDALLPHWDDLAALLAHEVTERTDGNAPATYVMMRMAIAGGTPCDDCAGTGNAEPCPKCKGTGRRGGGRCRADDCFRGHHLCPTCRGEGFTGGTR